MRAINSFELNESDLNNFIAVALYIVAIVFTVGYTAIMLMFKRNVYKRYGIAVIVAVCLALLALLLLRQFDQFSASTQLLSNVSIWYVAAAWSISLVACICSAGNYVLLALKRLPFKRSLTVQLAGLFVNRILPSGIGGIALNIWNLQRARHSLSEATAIAATNNGIGLITHVILIACALVFAPTALPDTTFSTPKISAVTVTVVVIAVGSILFIGLYKRRVIINAIANVWHAFIAVFSQLRRRPRRIPAVLLLSAGVTISSVVSLYICCHAIGLTLSPVTLFLIYSFSVFAGSAAPTPGGLGAIEASLVAGIVLYGPTAASALAAVLLCRFATYWLGLVTGIVALLVLRRNQKS